MVSERSIRPHIAVKRNPGLLFSHCGLRQPDLCLGQGELAPSFPASGSGRRQACSGTFAERDAREVELDGREEVIQKLLALDVSKSSIAKITGVDRATLYHFIRSRGLMAKELGRDGA